MNVQNTSDSQDCLHIAWWKQLEEMTKHTCTKMHSVCIYEQNVQNTSKGVRVVQRISVSNSC